MNLNNLVLAGLVFGSFQANAISEPPMCGEQSQLAVAQQQKVSTQEVSLHSSAILGDGVNAIEITFYRIKNRRGFYKVDVNTDDCTIRRIEYINH